MNIPNDTGNMWRLDRYVEYYNIRHSQNDGDVHNLGIVCQDADLDTKCGWHSCIRLVTVLPRHVSCLRISLPLSMPPNPD